MAVASNKAIRTAVEAGLCATAISDLVVAKSLQANTLFQIDDGLAKRSFYVLRHKERHVSKAETAVIGDHGCREMSRRPRLASLTPAACARSCPIDCRWSQRPRRHHVWRRAGRTVAGPSIVPTDQNHLKISLDCGRVEIYL
jgi:hypothetical protein